MEFPKDIHVDFFNDSTKIENQMDARFAEYYETKNQVFLKDSVKVFNNTSDTLFCQELWWDQTNCRNFIPINPCGSIVRI